jgi:hypothetical protein
MRSGRMELRVTDPVVLLDSLYLAQYLYEHLARRRVTGREVVVDGKTVAVRRAR